MVDVEGRIGLHGDVARLALDAADLDARAARSDSIFSRAAQRALHQHRHVALLGRW